MNGDSCVDKLPTANATNNAGYATSKISNIFGAGNPLHGVDVISVFLCTNGENPSPGGTFSANYKTLIEQIHTLEPQARFVGILGFSGGCTTGSNTNLSTSGGLWDQLAAEGIHIYRTGASTVTGGDLCDGLHPNAGGYAKMVTDIYPTLRRALRGGTPG